MSGQAAGEFDLIERYFAGARRDESVLVGIGDDAAIVDPAVFGNKCAIAVATDTLVAGVHFPEGTPADSIGHRALAVNLSDLAAVGAEPRWWLLALTLPRVDEAWMADFAEAALRLADRFSVRLIGGDLTRGPLTITVQAMGTLDPATALRRAGARAGDDVYVSGHPGDAAAGLALLGRDRAREEPEAKALIGQFLYPEPRIGAGRALGRVASAAIDVSDGLAADLGHICAASGCGARIDTSLLPLSAAIRRLFEASEAERLALGGGDDYELLFTAPADRAAAVRRAMREAGIEATRIGSIVEGDGVVLERNGVPLHMPETGFRHF